MFDKYNHSYQMYALRQNSIMFKFKKINVCLDDDWILCEFNNNTNTNTIHQNVVYKNPNIYESFIKFKYEPINKNTICKKINIDEPITKFKPTKNSILPSGKVDLYSSRSMTDKPVNDNNTNNFLTNHSVWFYSLYKKFMNIIGEVDILKKILLFNEKLPPSISI